MTNEGFKPYTEVPAWDDEERKRQLSEQISEYNPDSKESRMIVEDEKGRKTTEVVWRPDGVRVVTEFDPETGKVLRTIPHLPRKDIKTQEIGKAADDALKELEDKMKGAA